MALFPFLKKSNQESYPSSLEFEYDYSEPSRAYLKRMALETVIGFIAKNVAMSDFRFSKNGKRIMDDNHYVLNVRPNTDQSAFEFWYSFIFKLLHNGEALIIKTDSNDLLIADSFDRIEYAVYPDIFKNVVVKDYEFERNYTMDEVIYLKYGNVNLNVFMDGMFKDYTDLFNRMIANNLRSNQVRGVVEVESIQTLEDPKRRERLQQFISDLYKNFTDKAFAIVPQIKGFNYSEIANGSVNTSSVNDLTSLKSSLIDEVCDILSVPQALVHGDIADMDSLMKAFVKFCINPLNKMIEDELNVKIIGKKDYMNGERIEVRGIKAKDLIDNAEAVDKLVASGSFSRNEVRVEFGYEPVDDPELDKFLITRNYMYTEEMKTEGN